MESLTSIQQHIVRADGTRTLVLFVDGPLPDVPATILADVGGAVTDLGDAGATISWTWGPDMAPPNVEQACTHNVEVAVIKWAMRWANVEAVDLR